LWGHEPTYFKLKYKRLLAFWQNTSLYFYFNSTRDGDEMKLKDKRVLVIGGTSGIGRAVAEGALAEGANVIVASSSADKVEAAVKGLGERASGATLDVSAEKNIEKFFAENGKFDHIAFTAGDLRPSMFAPLAEMDFEEAAKMMTVRFWGALGVAKHAAKLLPPGGSITVTNGLLAHRPMKGSVFITAMAGATEHATRAMALELAPIRVNCVCPGLIRTELVEKFPKERLEMWETMTQRYPVPRAGQPAEAAAAYLYSMCGGYTTGQILFVEGGALITS
jgi:NAD(P)-dependent dehydrogenase (short-subunit alcohol dehydrogenase family)